MTKLITPLAYCDLTGISLSTAAKQRMTGHGPKFCKIGRKVMYPADAVEEFIQARVRTQTSAAVAGA